MFYFLGKNKAWAALEAQKFGHQNTMPFQKKSSLIRPKFLWNDTARISSSKS
jgi:hypothetical protein